MTFCLAVANFLFREIQQSYDDTLARNNPWCNLPMIGWNSFQE